MMHDTGLLRQGEWPNNPEDDLLLFVFSMCL
jgi:hypothetical protein